MAIARPVPVRLPATPHNPVPAETPPGDEEDAAAPAQPVAHPPPR